MKVENKFKATYNLYKENTYQYIRCHIRSDVNETKRHNAKGICYKDSVGIFKQILLCREVKPNENV